MMLYLIMIFTVLFLAVTVVAFKNLPLGLQNLVAVHPGISFAFEMMVSMMIAFFTGAGMMAGVANVASGLLFAIYTDIWFKRKYGIILTQKSKHPFAFWPLRSFTITYPAVIRTK